jgi:hypothetical protein
MLAILNIHLFHRDALMSNCLKDLNNNNNKLLIYYYYYLKSYSLKKALLMTIYFLFKENIKVINVLSFFVFFESEVRNIIEYFEYLYIFDYCVYNLYSVSTGLRLLRPQLVFLKNNLDKFALIKKRYYK